MTIKTFVETLRKARESPTAELDLVEMVLVALSDQDLMLLHVHAILREAGFEEGEIAKMMSDRWSLFQQGIDRFSQAAIKLASQ